MRLSRSFLPKSARSFSPTSLAALFCLALPAAAQSTPAHELASLVAPSLPDSPGSLLRAANLGTASVDLDAPTASSSSTSAPPDASASLNDGGFGQSLGRSSTGPASRTDKYIDPGQQAPALTAGDKVRLGIKDAVSPFAIVGWISSAAYSQALDSAPNYGQGWGPFAQRFGASAARAASEGVLSDSVFAPIFHEDPRYYRLGPGHNLLHRTLYAVTRTVVTKSDSGRVTTNLALLAGNAAGSVLTNAYYPQINRDAKTTVETFAGSIGGSALGFFVSEFLSDALGVVHLKKSE